MKWSLIWIAFPLSVNAYDFPAQQVERHCRVAMHYITYELDECILQQCQWFVEASESPEYGRALWYGQKRNWKGEVVGMDFKLVIERINYLNK